MNFLCGVVLQLSAIRLASVAAVGVVLFSSETRGDLIETVAVPGVKSSSAFDKPVMNFNKASLGYHSTESFSLGTLTDIDSGEQVNNPPDQSGGAANPTTGQDTIDFYVNSESVSVALNALQAYFGFWGSATDALNHLSFFYGKTLMESFTQTATLLAQIPSAPLPTGHNGNPTANFLGQDPNEKFEFINFYAPTTANMFDKIVPTNVPRGSTHFESDSDTSRATIHPASRPDSSKIVLLGIGGLGFAIGAYRRLRLAA